jgi:hypothetical protein
LSGVAQLSPEAEIICNRAVDTDIEEILAGGVTGSSLEEAGVSAGIVLDKATIEPRLHVPYTLWSPSLALPLDSEGHHGKGHAVSGVTRKQGWSADSDTDQQMEAARRVYTRDAERI